MAALETSAQTDNLFGYTDKAVTKEVDKYKEDVNTKLSFKDAATFVAEATPIIGDALAAKEVYDELQKDDPNYLLVGALGGAALVGLIPGLGDAAAKAIKTGAKKALDTAKRIEVDPNTLGSVGGNINLKAKDKPKEKIRYRDDIDPEVYDAFEELADIQRGKPELAMVEAQNILSGGVLPYALEHTGDLTHRMAEKGGVYGSEYVTPKVDRLLNSLLSEYGFEKEMSENIASNARFKYENEKPNISFEQYEKEYQEAVNQALKKYAEEHKKVPVYNEMQLAGREAAVALGEGRYTDAAENLYKIKMALNDKNYAEKSMQFNPEIDFRNKPKDFNKGGAVMNEQMEMAFMQEGGLKDDGMGQDPVSGNEVPSGSMASEVRDDISAQLSEGEYVVPADVVRYLGVKHFEDLRDKAKQGLQSMEANGRIGGEPVPVGGPQAAPMMQPPMPQAPTPQMAMGGDLSPEEMNEINNIMMAQGGMVPDDSAIFTDPYQQQQTQHAQPMAQGLDVGGPVTQPPAIPEMPQASPYSSTPSGGFSWEDSVSITDTEVPVENEDSCKAKGKVFNEITGMCEEPETPVIETPVIGSDDSDGPTTPPTGTQTEGAFGFGTFGQGVDWTDTEQTIKFIDGEYTPIDPKTREAVVGAGMIIGGPLALLTGAATTYDALEDISSLRASVIIAKAYGNTAAEQHAQAKLEDYLAQAPAVATGIVGDWLAKGTGKAGNLFKSLGINLSGNPEDWDNQQEELQKLRDDSKKKKPVAPAADKQKTLSGVTQSQMDAANAQAKIKQKAAASARRDDKDSGPSGAEVAAAAAQKASEKEVKESKDKPQGNLGSSSGGAGAGGFGGGGGGGVYAGGRATGGLVSRPKKKK